MTNASVNNKRIAKNTLMLYFRTLVVMLVSLYTSRLVLNALGIFDYGIYSVVGGVVGMFSAVTNSLSITINRFITFEVGKGDLIQINRVFCASYNLIIPICLIVFLIGEIGGIWFVINKLNIPDVRTIPAIWSLNALLFSLCLGIMNAPYNALIVAYEKMSVFAYISVLEAILKLFVCLYVIIAPYDKLILYSISMAVVSAILRLVYWIYCKRHYQESNFHFISDKQLTKDLGKYAGLSSTTHAISCLNTQGVTILLNLFFGIILNAARGIAVQIQNIITSLVSNITAAITPQITKSYANRNYEETGKLVCKGARFVYLLLLCISVPLLFETDSILHLWLGNVPPYTACFIRLTLLCSLLDRLGDTVRSAIMASGKIKSFTVYINILTLLIFPLTWLAYYIGLQPEIYYIIFFIIYLLVNYVQFNILNKIISLPTKTVLHELIYKISICTLASIIIPYFVVLYFPSSFTRLVVSVFLGLIWTSICIFITGLTQSERIWIVNKAMCYLKKHLKNEKNID